MKLKMYTRFLPFLIASLLIFSCGSSGEDQQDTAGEVQETPDDTVPTARTVQPDQKGNIRVESPRPGEKLGATRFTIRGMARTFESNVLYRLVYDSVLTIAHGFTTAAAPDIGQFGPFTIDVEYTTDWGGPAVLEVYEASAKDGSEINMVRIPVVLPPPAVGTPKQVYVYFPNVGLEKGASTDCQAVYPVRRELPGATQALARGVLYYLLKGLSEKEQESGYRSVLPEGLRLHSLALDSGIVQLQFSHHLNQIKKQCDIETVRAQIEQTLAQFPSVNAVSIGVDGMAWATGR